MLTRRAVSLLRRPPSRAPFLGILQRRTSAQTRPQHTTYFQEQPTPTSYNKPKLRWRIFRGTLIALVSLYAGWVSAQPSIEKFLDEQVAAAENAFNEMNERLHQMRIAAEPRDYLNAVRGHLSDDRDFVASAFNHGTSLHPSVRSIAHVTSIPSNLPCEDQHSEADVYDSTKGDLTYSLWGIYDGHAGPNTARLLKLQMGRQLIQDLEWAFSKYGELNDSIIDQAIQHTFLSLDTAIMDMATVGNEDVDARLFGVAAADAGSCALLAIHDHKHSVLRVANAGDSRAVLGRWDEKQQKYIALPMSTDHTGFNEAEVKRLKAEHPGEDVIDPKTGRLFGLAVTRAFGDSRWKLPESMTTMLHQKFWAYPPRPKGVVKTPPYVTALPEVTQIKLQGGSKADFLIMASDGLWDLLSSEQAVELVEMWLNRYKPRDPIVEPSQTGFATGENLQIQERTEKDEEDVYYDPGERTTKWRNSSKHFVVEDDVCSIHLVRNALGGTRTGLVNSILAVPPARSRDVRDDITVNVVFFFPDTSGIEFTNGQPTVPGRTPS